MAPALPALMPEPELITPSAEDWLAMTPEQRDAFLDEAHNTLEAEAARAATEAARAATEASRAEAEAARAATAIFSLQSALLTVLRLRGIEVSEAQRDRVRGTASPETLAAWLARAETAETADEALAAP